MLKRDLIFNWSWLSLSQQSNNQMSNFYRFEREEEKEQKGKEKMEPKEKYDSEMMGQKKQQYDNVFKQKQQKSEDKMRKSILLKDEEGQELGWCHNCCACTKLQFYKEYFKVTNNDVINRIKKNIFFWSGGFFEPLDQEYDFYGPFWIYTTIVFCLSAVSNIIRYQSQDSFKYNFGVVGIGFGFMYIEGFLFPALLTFLLKFFGGNYSHIQVLCLYGYSMSTYIVCLLLCSFNVCILHYILLAYGTGVKIAFIWKNLFEGQEEIETKKRLLVIVLVIIEAVVQFLVIKIVFIVCAVASTNSEQTTSHLLTRKYYETFS